MSKKLFLNRHLDDCKENYLEHFLFSMAIFLWLLVAAITLFIHALFPFIFAKKSSRHVKKINQIMQIRLSRSNLRNKSRSKSK